jgi:hypothetical protein
MANGVPLEEVNQILGLQIDALEARNPAEAAAILFAQHYAESVDRLDPDSLENLRRFYSETQAAEILAYVRAITLGSLTGNTVDAFLDRVRGRGHGDRRGFIVVFEGIVTLVAAPFVLAIALLAKFDRRGSVRHGSNPKGIS